MIEIDNSDRASEERRLQEKKVEEKKQLEKKMQREPMKTFEAKLSEKTASEITSKDSQIYKMKQEAKEKSEENQKVLEKVLGEASEKTDSRNQERLAALRQQTEQEYEQRDERTKERRLENKREHTHEEKNRLDAHKKDSQEVSPEGHRRVSERYQGGGEQGGRNMSGGGGKGGDEFGQGSKDNSKALLDSKVAKGQQKTVNFNAVAAKVKTRLMAGYEKNARTFTEENLDEIVQQIDFAINGFGEEEFTVTLSDDYFEGLQIKATRTDEGVVVTLDCPNVSVRSTFLKYRHRLYNHLKAKDVAVFRIDVR